MCAGTVCGRHRTSQVNSCGRASVELQTRWGFSGHAAPQRFGEFFRSACLGAISCRSLVELGPAPARSNSLDVSTHFAKDAPLAAMSGQLCVGEEGFVPKRSPADVAVPRIAKESQLQALACGGGCPPP